MATVEETAKAAKAEHLAATQMLLCAAVREAATFLGRCPTAKHLSNMLVGSGETRGEKLQRATCWGALYGFRPTTIFDQIEVAVATGLLARGMVVNAPLALTVTAEGERRLAALFV